MAAAAEKTATLIDNIVLADGLIINLSTVTTVTADDWIVQSKMETTKFGMAFTTADGTDQEAYNATNTIVLNVTGAATVMTIGDSVKSTGGST